MPPIAFAIMLSPQRSSRGTIILSLFDPNTWAASCKHLEPYAIERCSSLNRETRTPRSSSRSPAPRSVPFVTSCHHHYALPLGAPIESYARALRSFAMRLECTIAVNMTAMTMRTGLLCITTIATDISVCYCLSFLPTISCCNTGAMSDSQLSWV